MIQSVTPRTRQHLTEEKHDPRAIGPVLTQSLEDNLLGEGIVSALRATGYGALCAVRVSVNARIVVLEGRVASYYLKQLAQATALAVSGTHQIRNDLDVVHVTQPENRGKSEPEGGKI